MQFEKVNSETMPWRLPGGEGRTILQNGQAFFLRGLEIKPILLPRLGGWRQIEKLRAECAGSGGRGLLGSEKSSTPAQRRVICRVAGWRYLPELGTETYSRSDRKIQTPNTNDIKDGRSFRTGVKRRKISLLPASRRDDIRWNSGSWSHFHIRLNVSLPDLSLDQGFGLRSRSESVPWLRHSTLCAKMAWGIEYLLSSAEIRWASSFVLISSISPLDDVVEFGDLREVVWRLAWCARLGWWRMVVGGRMGEGGGIILMQSRGLVNNWNDRKWG